MTKLTNVITEKIETGDTVHVGELAKWFAEKGFEVSYEIVNGVNRWWSVLEVRDNLNVVKILIRCGRSTDPVVIGVNRRRLFRNVI